MLNLNVWISGYLFTSALVTILLAIHSMNKKDVTGAKAFSFLCMASSIYAFGYGMELLNKDLSITLFWNGFQYCGIEFIPVFWIIVALQYCGKEKILTTFIKGVLFTIPISTLIVRYTNSFHHLFFKNVFITSNGYFPIMFIEKGPLYIVSWTFISCCILYSNFLYFKLLIQSKGNLHYQSLLMFVASLLPWISYCLLLFNISPLEIDYTPIASTVSYILLLIGLFKYQFLNLVPLAHYKVFESIKDPALVLDNEFKILDYNTAAFNLFPNLKEDSIGKSLEVVFYQYSEFTNTVLENKEVQLEIKNNNYSRYFYVKISLLYGKFKKVLGYIVMLNDITEQVESMKKLELLASTDVLTGVYNRRYFIQCCESELEQAKINKLPLSLIMFDLDKFKHINDTFGHQAGDVVLRQVIDRTGKSLSDQSIFGRFGGEEFVILLPGTGIDESVEIAETIRKRIEELEILAGGHKIKVTVSIGVTAINRVDQEDLDYLINLADKAMYAAKNKGRNCVSVWSGE